jgi:ribulose-phosphate 3-epimerase
MGPVIVAAARQATRLPLDVHLMIENPERYLADFAQAGADGLTVQIEACPHICRVLQQIKELGKRAGVALNPGTPASAVSEILDETDMFLAMTVNPGFSGQQFLPGVLPKIRQLREWVNTRGRATDIEVDGGLNADTIPQVIRAGANVIVAASAIFKTDRPIEAAVTHLRRSGAGL